MKQLGFLVVLSTLMFLTACPQATTPPVTPEPQPPITPDPTAFPATAVSGTIPNWSGGEAYLTLAAGSGVSSTPEGETVTLVPPLYQAALSATGAFTVPLTAPAATELVTLTCGSDTYQVGLLTGAVVSSTPQPAQLAEVLGFYDLGSPGSVENALWLYSETALELNATCTLPNSGPATTRLNPVPGWNQVIVTYGEGARLESGAVPASLIWSEF